jgi:serine protease AprX
VRLPRLVLAGALTASVLSAPLALAQIDRSAATAVSTDATAGRWVVQLAEGVEAQSLSGVLTGLGVTSAVAFPTTDALALTAPRAVVDELLDSGAAVAARPERRLQLHLAESVPYIGADRATLGTPATVRVGGRTVERPAVDGTGTTVAVLDTGIADYHPDLVDRVVAHRNFELSYAADLLLTGEQLDAYALLTGESARTDDIGHGTHVAGTVAGTGAGAQNRRNNNRGVAPGAKLVDLRIAGGPLNGFVGDTGWERNALAAFDWLARHHEDTAFGPRGIQVNTNSWGLLPEDLLYGAPQYDPLREAVELLDELGVVTVFSAGNDGPEDDVTDATVPNGLPQVISVAAACKPGATSRACDVEGNEIGDFSSRGPSVDVAAPGVEIVSAVGANAVGAIGKGCAPAELGPVPCVLTPGSYGGEDASEADVAVNYALYGSLDGTSMAAPHVAGVVALLLQANPDLTPRQVQVILAMTARDLQAPGRDIESGHGLVDVPRALVAAARMKQGEPARSVFPRLRWSSSL